MVSLHVNGRVRADVSIDAEVTLEAIAHVSPGTGAIVTMEWDLDGTGRFPVRSQIDTSEHVVVEHRHTFDRPGTHFTADRVAAHRDGDTTARYARLQNVARARVVAS